MSLFWLILKQQWTIKISSPFFLFLAWRPSWLEVRITGYNFGRGPSKDHSTKVWLQLAQWFLRRRLKCEMLTDGRRMKSDGNSSHGLKASWAKKCLSYTCKGPSSGVVVVIVWYLDLQLSMQSMPITANVVSSNIAQARCTQYNIMWESLSTTFSSFLHQWNWQPRYNWNIVDNGIKHHNPNPVHDKQIVYL